MQEVFTELRKVPCLNSQYTKKKKKKWYVTQTHLNIQKICMKSF